MPVRREGSVMTDFVRRRQERAIAQIGSNREAQLHLASGFETTLFSRTDTEDLAGLDARRRAEIAAAALAALSAPRARGKAKVTLQDFTIGEGGADKVTVVHVINDNMPFLLDSTLNEITEQGLTLRLVAHPILSVDRDPS